MCAFAVRVRVRVRGVAFNVGARYRKQALRWHPDRNIENRAQAEQRFKAVSEAYQRLTRPHESQEYDFGRGGMGDVEQPSPEDMREAEELFKKMFGDRTEADIAREFNATLQRDMSAQLKSAFKGIDMEGEILQFHQEITKGPAGRTSVRTTAVIRRKNGALLKCQLPCKCRASHGRRCTTD
jgi:DnaJ-class molecular chaperone